MECKLCLSNETIPNLRFDRDGICQFCSMHEEMNKEYPLNAESEKNIFKIAQKIKEDGKKLKYDSLVGISGGRDSTFLLFYVKKVLKLRPLAVHYDNGFDSDVSVSNILKVCEKLDVDLETNVADWNSFKKITKSFFLAGVSDPDTPTDVGIFKTMYKTAYRENIKYVFNGHSFRTEGIEPLDWTYMDGKYIRSIHDKFGDGDLSRFDNFYISDLVKYKLIAGIKTILPLNYINYSYDKVEKILSDEIGWTYYGGHHHESLLTKFVVSCYLPKKFNIDRRLTSYSAMVRSKKISKNEAKKIISKKSILEDEEEKLVDYVLNKLDISNNQYKEILNKKKVNFRNFKTYYSTYKHLKFPIKLLADFNFIPKLLYLRYFG